MEGVVAGDDDEHIIRQHIGVEKLKEPVFARLHRGDVARQASERGAEVVAGLAKYPPTPPIAFAIIRVALGLYRGEYVLIDGGVTLAHFCFAEPKEINRHHAARRVREVFAVPVFADVLL